ncbi:DEAD/DEAH box helicase family protein [Cohnella cellulosilytica]|uniref:DEAD/DEAH box helicase family protein n=3 Tax=Cohnella cellulosilytica TaxID=986710 RepID=A0ABW2F8E7_9BACL
MKEFNRLAAVGIAVREFPTNSGPVDYLLFVDGSPVGVVEAKAEDKGVSLATAAEQSIRYAKSGLKYMSTIPDIRFIYESTGILTNFCDLHDDKARSRSVFSFHRPETLLEWSKDTETLRNRMKTFPLFDTQGFRDCQVNAILNLERSFSDNRPRALIQMATGAGKTYTAITSCYRLLKHAKAKRILFLVDTKNLGEQAEGEFLSYKPSDDGRLFSELYNVRRLNSSYIPNDTKVCISTIQRMYSILRGEEIDESAEETSLNEQTITSRPREVTYNPKYPPEFFDIIIIDECHRSIYNVWQQVLDYFDAFLVGLTATPDQRTFGFFKQNIVSEYTHEQAVLDDVNVGREGTYLIETQIGNNGGIILRQTVEKRDRLSRKKRWEQLDEDLNYRPSQLDKDVVNPSQIRSIIRSFKSTVLTEMFPTRQEIPKTLVFAKTDSHAEDIINIIREEFGEGNEFCKKITYAATEDPKSVLNAFRNDFYPRIAVTVDMIATGTDVKPIECLIFMRDVRSKNYFEQMLGRATRTLDYENLRRVSPSATQRKLGYVIVDAVGVTKSQKTASRQLERKPTVSLKDLMMSVAMGARDEDTLTSLASRLIKLDKVMTESEKQKFISLCDEEGITLGTQIDGGITVPFHESTISPKAIAETLLNAFDEDVVSQIARKKYNLFENEDATDEQFAKTSGQMATAASVPFHNSKIRNHIENVRKSHDQVVDNVNIDQITFSGWDSERAEKAGKVIDIFSQFIEDNRSSIEALEIIYSQSYKHRPLTLKMVKELYDTLQKAPYYLTTEKLWTAYATRHSDKVKEKNVVNQLADIISLIRFELGQTSELSLFSSDVNVRFQSWIWNKNKGHGQFTEEQTEWLRMVRDHIATSMQITADDLDFTPFDSKGGLGRFYQLFGNEYESILNEMNYALVA